MGARIAIALAAAFLTSACAGTPDGDATSDSRMKEPQGFAARNTAAREICAAAGFGERTPLFAHCVASYHAREAARLRAEARSLAASAARRQGLCLDPVRFELGRCIEI